MWDSKRDVIAMLIIAFGFPLLAVIASLVIPLIFDVKRVGLGGFDIIDSYNSFSLSVDMENLRKIPKISSDIRSLE
jgi:hypothetical protein